MRKLETTATLCATLVLSFASGLQASEYYTWVDENGVTNYSERAPKGYQTTRITESQRFGYKSRNPSDPAAESRDVPFAEESREGGEEDIDPDAAIAGEKAMYEAELAAEREHNCKLGKQNLARLETYARIRVQGDDGKVRYLTAEEMAAKKKESREAIKFHCR